VACLNDRSKALFPGNALAVLRDEITHAGTRQGRAAPQRVGRGLLHAWLTCSRHSIRHLPMIMRAELKPSGTSCAPLSFPSRWAMRSAPSPQASLSLGQAALLRSTRLASSLCARRNTQFLREFAAAALAALASPTTKRSRLRPLRPRSVRMVPYRADGKQSYQQQSAGVNAAFERKSEPSDRGQVSSA
jgi:hypothetical protein